MSRRQALLHVLVGLAATGLLLVAAAPFDSSARGVIEAILGIGSAAAWAGSAYLYGKARLSARVNLLAAALAGAACIVAVAPAAPHPPHAPSGAASSG